MSENEFAGRRIPTPFRSVAAAVARRRDRAILAICGRVLAPARNGRLALTLPSGESRVFGARGAGTGVDASVTLDDFAVFRRSLERGSLGFAQAYMDGTLHTPDLAAIFRFYLDNQDDLGRAFAGQFKVRAGDTRWHHRRANTRAGSRRNIEAHYDLGNAFYAAWLDPSMTYSSALYRSPADSLAEAQHAKLGAIVTALDVKPGMRVLEIGCGWGALAERLARAGCHVTALTLSQEQLSYTRARAAAAGLADRVAVELCDYRDAVGTYDRIVSVEMIEAVGEAHWPAYFGAIAQRLAPGGHAIVQAITIAEARFARYRAKADFIQRYIFPGGMLPTEGLMEHHARAAGLAYAPHLRFGASYARTLADWRGRFEDAWPRIEAQGFDARFRRMWRYYLTYCEVGFERGATDVGLYRFAKPA